MFIDSHAHLEDKKFARDLDRVLMRASDSGVERIIIIGDAPDTSRKSVALARRNEKLYAAVGIHPHHAKRATEADFDLIAELADDPRVVAIGEIGLDFHYPNSDPKAQKDVMVRQIGLAREKGLPLVLHCRDAYADTFKILKKEKADQIGGVIHCFSGEVDDAKRIIDMGWYIGIGGPITFSHADKLRAAIEATPLDRILIETDSPYLPPQVKRGRRNEPSYLKFIVKALADVKEHSFQEAARATKMNTVRLFNLPVQVEPEIAYSLSGKYYLNITNACSNRCQFCPRYRDYGWLGYNLRLDSEPEYEDLVARIEEGVDRYDEFVFCGFGEPTERLDLLLQTAKYLKGKGKRIRLNTNGQGCLIHGTDIFPRLRGSLDAVSISLNAANREEYNDICRPENPEKAFEAVIDFIKKAKKNFADVDATVVAAPGVDVEACRALAEDKLKVRFRIREYVPIPKSESALMSGNGEGHNGA